MDPVSTRDAYGDALIKLGSINNNVVVLDCDLSTSTQTNKFAKKFPERFFNVGCAEQNLIGVSSGLAVAGKISFASTYAIFSCRAWEQIRNTVAHDNLNVKLAVSHSGLTNGADGASHQSIEDIAIMRVIPNMTVIVPCDGIEAEKAVFSEANRKGPAYIRLNRIKTPVIFDESYVFSIGKGIRLTDGRDIGIISTGTMVHEALEAEKILRKDKIYASVLNIHTIKPLDKKKIIDIAKETGCIITVEEHSIYGGLGSAVAEVLVSNYPIRMITLGVNDVFGESGEYIDLLKKHGLTASNIVNSVRELLRMKK